MGYITKCNVDRLSHNLTLQYGLFRILRLLTDQILESRQFNLLQLLVDFCYSSSLLGPCYFVSAVVHHHLQSSQRTFSSNEDTHYQRLRLSFKNVTERLSICWIFSEHLDSVFLKELNLTAKSFGETERVCISRLIAIHRIQSFKETSGEKTSQIDFEKVFW